MTFLRQRLARSALRARAVPFFVFVALTVCQGRFGEEARYWIYLIKTLVGAWLIYEVWPLVPEMRWAFSWEAVLVGVAVFGVWVGLDDRYPKLTKRELDWNPIAGFATAPALAWLFIAVRLVGSSLVVPPIEETFYRSFLYRFFARVDFLSMPMNQLIWLPLILTATLFGLSHQEWLAGILCGLAYQWLVLRKNRLGDAMTAHAITNFLLGVWVVLKGDWHFW
jgi:CAAX prenyl protease-like protein